MLVWHLRSAPAVNQLRVAQDLALTWGFPKTRGTILEVLILRIIAFWGLYWGPPILGNYHMLLHDGHKAQGLSKQQFSTNRGPLPVVGAIRRVAAAQQHFQAHETLTLYPPKLVKLQKP